MLFSALAHAAGQFVEMNYERSFFLYLCVFTKYFIYFIKLVFLFSKEVLWKNNRIKIIVLLKKSFCPFLCCWHWKVLQIFYFVLSSDPLRAGKTHQKSSYSDVQMQGRKKWRNCRLNIYVMYPCCPNVSTTPITAMGCRQCLPLSVEQLKGNIAKNAIAVMGL